jgi:ribonucleoside-diphosphate reductase beta chain
MSIFSRRSTYMPFEYDQAYQYWLKQNQAHWLHSEISMSSDITDWKENLTTAEKNLIGQTLKGFIQVETIVNDYWGRKVHKWFPKVEIGMMSSAFANMETIHTKSYAYLNESLGLEDYDAFLHEPTAKARIDRLIDVKSSNSHSEIAKSIAIFSAFGEGVALFSQFAILLSFSQRNLMKGLGQIISFSVRDESLHSEAGCWLFRQIVSENPSLLTDDLKKAIYEAARLTVKLEDEFIDKAFEMGDIEGLSAKDLKAYIRHRANVKLGDIGFKPNWNNIDKEAVGRMKWFDYFTAGVQHTDFFSQRVSDYSKGNQNWDSMYE